MAQKYEYEIRQVDAWCDSEGGWNWNTSYFIGTMKTAAKNEKRAFCKWLKDHAGITFRKNRTLINYDGSVYEIIDKKTKAPLFAAIPMF